VPLEWRLTNRCSFVVHYDAPKSVGRLLPETGRVVAVDLTVTV
jgi:hypothetical protein